MNLLRAWFAGMPAYLWSGWGAIASLLLLLAAWEGVSLVYGSLILPDPASYLRQIARTVRLRRGQNIVRDLTRG